MRTWNFREKGSTARALFFWTLEVMGNPKFIGGVVSPILGEAFCRGDFRDSLRGDEKA